MTAISAKKLDKAIRNAMRGWLTPLGFSLEESGGFGRWKDNIYTYVACLVDRRAVGFDVRPFGQMGFSQTQAIFSQFMSDNPGEASKISVDFQINYGNFVNSWSEAMHCQSEEELPVLLNSLKTFVLEKLYPTLMAYTDPVKLVDLYLQKDETNKTSFKIPSWHGHISALTALILSRLYSPEHYSSLRERYQPIFEGLLPEYKDRSYRLIAYLDQDHLAPLDPSRA